MEQVILYGLGALVIVAIIEFIRFEVWYHDHRKMKF